MLSKVVYNNTIAFKYCILANEKTHKSIKKSGNDTFHFQKFSASHVNENDSSTYKCRGMAKDRSWILITFVLWK
jgi:hypothetical protein